MALACGICSAPFDRRGGVRLRRSRAEALKWSVCAQKIKVHGYVGNKSAVFPMQTLGLEVDFVNSVQVQPSFHAVCVCARLPARCGIFLVCATNPVCVCLVLCVCVCAAVF